MKRSVLKIMAMATMLAVPAVQATIANGPVTAIAAEGTSGERPAKKYYVTSDTLNIRSGPGTDYSILGSLTRGMEVKVFSIRGENGNRWAKIRFAGVSAYASARHLAKK